MLTSLLLKVKKSNSQSDLLGVEEYHFNSKQWFDKKEGDEQIIREILATDADGSPILDIDGMTCFFFVNLINMHICK
jgi:hypothetical protein